MRNRSTRLKLLHAEVHRTTKKFCHTPKADNQTVDENGEIKQESTGCGCEQVGATGGQVSGNPQMARGGVLKGAGSGEEQRLSILRDLFFVFCSLAIAVRASV